MLPIYTKNKTIGLLGGSFNPAHPGHLHISEYALKSLGLSEIWWLVSPRNPLKPIDILADYKQRFASAQFITKHNRHIYISDIEKKINSKYTYETIEYLKKRYKGTNFVWLMGADNLAHFHRWQKWKKLLFELPIVVFDRAPYSFTSIASKTATRTRRFSRTKTKNSGKPNIPSLHFARLKRNPLSSTKIRMASIAN